MILQRRPETSPDEAAVAAALVAAFGAKGSGCCDGTRIAGFESGWHSSTPTTRRPGRPLGTTTCSPRPTRGCRPDSTAPVVARPRVDGGSRCALQPARLAPGARTRSDRADPLEVPSGSRIPIDYSSEDGPVLAVRLELFGLIESPAVLGGQVPLTLHLLSPAHRPVQMTQDLVSFWAEGYSEVRQGCEAAIRSITGPRIRLRRPRPAGNGAPYCVDHTVGATRRSRSCSIRLRAGPRRSSTPAHDGDRPVSSPGVRGAGGSRRVPCRRRRFAVEMVAVHGLVEGQHRCHTAVGGLEDGCPLVAGSGCEHGSDPFAEFSQRSRSYCAAGRHRRGPDVRGNEHEMPLDRGDRQCLPSAHS